LDRNKTNDHPKTWIETKQMTIQKLG